MKYSSLLDWTWPATFAKAIFTEDKAFYWKHIHGSSTFLLNGKPGTGIIFYATCIVQKKNGNSLYCSVDKSNDCNTWSRLFSFLKVCSGSLVFDPFVGTGKTG